MTPLQEKLMALDAFLTRKDQRTVEHTARNNKATYEKIQQDAYYLSDGGYSRIHLSWHNWRILLTSNSRPEVAELWPFAKELIADVEAAVKAEMLADGWVE